MMTNEVDCTDIDAVLAAEADVRVPPHYPRHANAPIRELGTGVLAWFLTIATPPAWPKEFRQAVGEEYRRRCRGGLMPLRLRPIAHALVLEAYENLKRGLEDEDSRHLLSDAKNALLVLLHEGEPPREGA
jgi:hypothetical protein